MSKNKLISFFTNSIRRYCIIVGILILLLVGCPHANNYEADSDSSSTILFKDIQYDLQTGKSLIEGKEIANPIVQYALSGNKRFLITSEVRNKSQPLIVLYDLSNDTEKILTEGTEIAYNPAVNSNGDYAYVCSSVSNSISKLFLNGSEITPQGNKLYYHLSMTDTFLFFSELTNKGILTIFRYNINSKYAEKILVDNDLKIGQAVAFNDDKVIMQAYSVSLKTSNIYVIDFAKSSVVCITGNVGMQNEFVRKIIPNNKLIVDSVISYNAPLVYSYMDFLKGGLGLPFAGSDNRYGRLCWNVSYHLEGLLSLCKALDYPKELVLQLNRVVKVILDGRNKYNGIPATEFTLADGWATRKYSLDKNTPINLLVNDAKVLYPLLKYAGLKICSNNVKTDILSTAKSIFDYHEKWYETGTYKFQKGISFHVDGVCQPWNQQNVFGLCLLEMYKLTSDEKYKVRAFELAQAFKSELVYTPKGRLVWFYWPKRFYKGWTKEQNISINTPERTAFTPQLYEDTSHAGINAKFIQSFYQYFPNEVFTDQDITALKFTAETLILTSGLYYEFLNMDEENYPVGYENAVTMFGAYGWNDFNLPEQKELYSNMFETGGVFFDSAASFSFIFLDNMYSKMINFNRKVYSYNLTLLTEESNISNIISYLFR